MSAWTSFQKMLFPWMAVQVQHKEMCSKQSGGAEFIWTICSFWFPIVIALKQLFKAKTSVLYLFPVMKSRWNTHQSILQPWIGREMSFCKYSFLPELPKSWSVSCFNLHWKSNVQVCMHRLLSSSIIFKLIVQSWGPRKKDGSAVGKPF